MPLELLFLGTGTSAGVPMIGCHCPVCTSADPRDHRDRPSVVVSYDDPDEPTQRRRQFIIDTTPEFRLQCLREQITRIDGVFYTHAHADHIFGLDDLRRFNAVMRTPIDFYADESTHETLRRMFRYIFDISTNINQSFVASLIPHMLTAGSPLQLFGATWTPIALLHGRLPILGLRVDWVDPVDSNTRSLAYCTDVSTIPPESWPLLANLDLLVIDGLRYRHHPTHMTIDEALRTIAQFAPRRACLTHIAHDISHADLDPRLPQGVQLAYDGLRVTL